jgi:OFA family oxalate/formate antiporter-like MFS transporter
VPLRSIHGMGISNRKVPSSGRVVVDRSRGALGAAALLMAALGTFHAWSVLVQPLQDELDASRSTVSAIYALATLVFATSMLLEPALHRRLPAVALGAGSALLAAGGLALSAVPAEAAVFVGYGVLFAVANGIGYALAVHIAATVGRTGATAGLMVAAYAVGGSVVAPLLSVAARDAGLTTAFLGLAAVMALVAAVQVAFLGPAEPGIHPPEGGAAVGWAALGRDRVFWLLWAGFLGGSAAGLVVIGHGAAIVASLGGGAAALTVGASMAAAGNGVGRLGAGGLADRVSVRTVIIGGSLLAAVALLGLAAGPAPAVAVAALGVSGIAYGTIAVAYPVAAARYYGARATAPVYARIFTAWGLAGVTAPIAAGALFDATGGYRTILVILAGGSLLAALASVALPPSPSRAREPASTTVAQ